MTKRKGSLGNIPDEADNYDVIVMRANVNRNMHEIIRNQVEHLKQLHSNKTVFLVLRTGGGDPMYAYRTMKLLNARYNNVYCLVPDISMSAGTLMALGAVSIGMLSDSCLGPLDLQISHPDPNDDSRMSTLDVRDTASSTSFEAARVATNILVAGLRDGLPKRIAERMATNITSTLYSSIMAKIDPYHMHESIRNAELSTRYGTRLLQTKMLKNRKDAATISSTLANSYSYHGYAIISDEAKEIGLSVFDLSQLPTWKGIQEVYDATHDGDIISISSEEMKGNQIKESR